MSRETVLARGRAAAEAGMVDTCTIRRITGETTDPDTGAVTPTYTSLITNQACRIQTRGNWGERRDVGQAGVVVLSVEVQLPVAVTGLRANDEVVITAAKHDVDLVGRVYRLRDPVAGTHKTSHRFMSTEVIG